MSTICACPRVSAAEFQADSIVFRENGGWYCSRLCFLLIGACIAIGLGGCGKSTSDSTANRGSDTAAGGSTASPQQVGTPVAAATTAKLPEFYGIYAIDGSGATPMAMHVSPADNFSGDVQFIVYSKGVSLGDVPDQLLKLSLEVPHRVPNDGNFTWATFLQQNQQNAEAFDAAMSGVPRGSAEIPARTKPIAGQTEMVQVVPEQPLVPGLYQFRAA